MPFKCVTLGSIQVIKCLLPGDINREFKQIATAGAATAIAVEEVRGEYVAVARQNSTLSNAKYKQYGGEVLKLISVFEEVFVRLKTLNDFVQRNKGFYFTLL